MSSMKILTGFSCLLWIGLEVDQKVPLIWSHITLFECNSQSQFLWSLIHWEEPHEFEHSFHISGDQSTQIIILARRGGSRWHKMSISPSDYRETWLKPHNPVKGNWLVNLGQYAWCYKGSANVCSANFVFRLQYFFTVKRFLVRKK